MPFKHNAARRHRIPRARYRIRNWPAYEAGLQRRGDLTLWVDEAALAGWRAPRRSTPGGQPVYADLAIEAVLSLRLVFHLALRQAAGLAGSVLRLLGLDLPVPDHATLSRRGRAFAGRQPRARAGNGPRCLVLDSTGLELFGQGEWDATKHGRRRRRWMKLHLAVDATTGEIAAHVLTEGTADDAAQAPDLLRTVEGAIASLTADGAYDGEPTYEAARTRQPDPPPDGHRQLVELRLRWGAIGTACSWLRRSGDAGDLGPSLEGLAPGGSILGGGHLMGIHPAKAAAVSCQAAAAVPWAG